MAGYFMIVIGDENPYIEDGFDNNFYSVFLGFEWFEDLGGGPLDLDQNVYDSITIEKEVDRKMTTYTTLQTLVTDLKALEGIGPVTLNLTVLCGLNGTTLVPVKVDSAGRQITIMSDEVEV
jgi:hypothetical protein